MRTPDDELGRIVRRLLRTMHVLDGHDYGGVRVTLSEVMALGELDADQPLTQRELGDRLGLDKSTISRLVGAMESRGWLARERDPRNRRFAIVSLTEAGATLSSKLSPALALIRDSLSETLLATDQPSGTVRVNSSYVAYRTLIEPHLPEFLAGFPLIHVEISLDNVLGDIVNSGYDIGIRMGKRVQNDMVAKQLGATQRRIVVAAPDYFRGRTEPKAIDDLLKHDCIRQRYSGGGRWFEWKFDADGQTVQIEVHGRLLFDEMKSVVDAAVQGQGVGFVFEDFAKQELAGGQLQRVLKQHSGMDDAFHLYYPHRTHMPGKLRAFIDFMTEANAA
jgi:DNA-binding transcriptional LysR family regulator